jgi:hypothetical protein
MLFISSVKEGGVLKYKLYVYETLKNWDKGEVHLAFFQFCPEST